MFNRARLCRSYVSICKLLYWVQAQIEFINFLGIYRCFYYLDLYISIIVPFWPLVHYKQYECCTTNNLSIVAKKFYRNDHTTTEFGIIDNKKKLLRVFWTRTGGWEFDRSHGAGTSSPSQGEEQAPKPLGWMMCFLLMTFVPVQKLCVNIYIYLYICSSIWVVFFGLPIVSCSLMIIV